MDRHLAILGDSIFDNAPYIGDGRDVTAHLSKMLEGKAQVTRLAMDGSTTSDVFTQLASRPRSVTHLAVSAGGNDILHHVNLLEQPASSVAETIAKLASAQDELARSHAAMLRAVAGLDLPVAVCTIYDTNYGPPIGKLASTAMSIFNDVITRHVHLLGCDLLDLRLVCTEPGDFANPIEPSDQGGEKIARVITDWVLATEGKSARTQVFV